MKVRERNIFHKNRAEIKEISRKYDLMPDDAARQWAIENAVAYSTDDYTEWREAWRYYASHDALTIEELYK